MTYELPPPNIDSVPQELKGAKHWILHDENMIPCVEKEGRLKSVNANWTQHTYETSLLTATASANKGKLGFQTSGAVITYKKQIEQILNSGSEEIQNLAGEFGTPLPKKMKDLGDDQIGNYYVKGNGELVRYAGGGKLLKINDAGFTGEIPKRKKKKKKST